MSKYTTIIGIGSLLNEKSARITCPDLHNFRKIELHGYKRIFNLTSPVTLKFIGSDSNSLELAALNTIESKNSKFLAVAFDIPNDQVTDFEQRESGYKHLLVPFIEKSNKISHGILCVGFNNDEDLIQDPKSDKLVNTFRKELNYNGKILRDDILPWGIYLKYCIDGAEKLGKKHLDSFLDESFLADGITSIRNYLKSNPSTLKNLPKHNIKNYK